MPRIFISCVSNEFAGYRDAIRKDLTRPNLDTKIQEDFIAFGGPTLEKLDEYIQHCDAIIHFCGDMTGSMANALSLQYINNKYKDFAIRFPQLKPVLEGKAELSYTQWEAYLAAYFNKRLFVVAPKENAIKDGRYVKEEAQLTHQEQHLKYLEGMGYYAEIQFNNEDELAKKLYQSKLGEIIFGVPKHKPVNLPYHSIGTAFKGREDFIKDLYETFRKTTNSITAIAVHALGGMGKTRLAVEYAWQYKNDYTALLFINANSPELLTTNIANLAEPKLLNLPEHEAQEEETKYNAVINWLNQYTGWLMILDNADTKDAVKNLRDFLSKLQHGHIIITSRIDNWANPIKHKELKVLDEDSAINFLMESTNGGREENTNDRATARLVANDLGCLALALDQAKSYINTNATSFENYRKTWEAKRKAVLVWYDELQTEYPASVAITWQTSFNQLSANATTLLNRLCWLAPDPVPRTLLEVEVPDTESIDAAGAWQELKQYSLATASEDKKSFTIHKLVQDVTRMKMDETLALQTLTETLNWLDDAFIGDPTNVNDWPILEPLVPHILTLSVYARKSEINHPTGRLINNVSLLFKSKAQYRSAEPLIKTALEIFENSLGSDHPYVAASLNNLATLLKATNRLQEAEPLMRRALEIDEQSFGASHPNVAIRLNNLAQLLEATNRLQEAEPLMRRALEIDEQSFGTNHPNVAIRLNNLAQLLQATNRLQEAEPLMRRALEIDEQSFGTNHPDVGRDLNNLAQLLQATNRLQEAEPLMRRVLEILENSLGSNHPNIASSLNNLAQLLQDTNRLQEAEPLMRRALEIDEQSFGANHPNVAIDLNNLALLLQNTNRLQEAEPLMRRALEIDEQSFGANHPNVAIDLNNLAQLLQDTNRLREAEPLMRRALEIDEQSFGANHPNVATNLNNLAQLLKDTNHLQGAEPLMRRAFIILNNLEYGHPNAKAAFGNYIYLLQKMGKSEEEIQTILSTLLG